MKKRFFSLCLAMALLLAPASAAFSDISDSKLSQTATVLDALGIMQGVGGGRFSPDTVLTRAQFCKLAVVSLGVKDASAYGSYTIFPDVRNTHWASPYINAAVRDPALREHAIIRGYADGTFGPDKSVNFGEACTMLLRMLGYTDADIGPFWPQDYVARAGALGLTNGVSITNATAAVKRADAATLLLRTLLAETKDGGKLIDNIASSTIEDCILLATSETDSSLSANEAIFYENGAIDETPRRTAGTLDKGMIGVYGTLLIGKEPDRVALGVVPDQNRVETLSVVSAAADGVQTTTQTFRPSRDAKLFIGGERRLGTYAELWSDILAGDTLTLYYNEYGTLELIAVLGASSTVSSDNSFVYGLATSPKIPDTYTVVKNGVSIDRSQLKKYDVITLDAGNRQALASDARLSGYYGTGTPTFSYPQQIKLFEDSYTISDSAAKYFQDFKLGDYITLLFDVNGRVAAAYPKTTVSADMLGVITDLGEGGTATIAMTNGRTVKASLANDSTGTQLLGKLVTLGQTSTRAYVTVKSLSGKEAGDWSVQSGLLGSKRVSSKVRVYEEVLPGAPLNQIALRDVSLATVPAKQIKYTIADNAGTITNIVLDDVTGESWIYGIGYGSTDKGGEGETYYVDMRHWENDKFQTSRYRVLSLPSGLNGSPVGIPKGYNDNESIVQSTLSTLPLILVDTVGLSAFDGSSGARTSGGYYQLADEIGVYVSSQRTMMSLSAAKNNYTNFRLYANKTAANGGKIRVIVAS